MKFFRETEKAAQVKMVLDYDQTEHEAEKMVWIPKSQIRGGKLTAWIADAKLVEFARGEAFATFFDADGAAIDVERRESSAREKKAEKDFAAELARTFGKLNFKHA